MRLADWLAIATAQLKTAGLESARLDSLLLLETTTGLDRSTLLAHPEHELSAAQTAKLNTMLTRRSAHEPIAYIRGSAEFYGRTYIINSHVLVPRPETETMIELLLTLPVSKAADAEIVDVGTGSGALAITAKLELPDAHVTALDIDPACLIIAHQNSIHLEADIDVIQSDLLNNFVMQKNNVLTPVILLANLPYVPTEHAINEAAKHEPELALYSGSDGLNHYRALFDQSAKLAHPPQYILTESLAFQHDALNAIASKHGYSLEQSRDLIQVFRYSPN